MAGMIHEQTKQQLNGMPGLMNLPVLGSLFKSRDYINRQSELMVLVTPYIVRAVAQKDLSKPDDGFADASDPATTLDRPLQPHLRRSRPRRIETATVSRQLRFHSRLSHCAEESISMPAHSDPISTRGYGLVLRRAAIIAALGTMLGACNTAYNTAYTDYTATMPSDYRERHPISIQGG